MSRQRMLAHLLDPDCVREMLEAAGAGASATEFENLLLRCAHHLRSQGVLPQQRVHAAFVPGRIEVLGKHTDYAGGRSLLAALDRGICVVAAPRSDRNIAVTDALTGARTFFRLSADLKPTTGWPNYPMTVARRVARNFPGATRGANVVFASNLPKAAGMSSSSALIVGVFLALSAVNDLPSTQSFRDHLRRPEDLADYLAAVESGRDFRGMNGGLGVGTDGGSQDHTAILCARREALVQYSFAPARFECAVPFPPRHVFIIAVSGVVAEKTGAARERYNRAAEQIRCALRYWQVQTEEEVTSLGAVLVKGPAEVDRLRSILRNGSHPCGAAGSLLARIDQFIEESSVIIPAASAALASGDLAAFGRLVDASQKLAETALQNQVPETIALARSARELGADAASAFGAGFGGSVWALVEESRAGTFIDRWCGGYLSQFRQRAPEASFFIGRPGTHAVQLA